MHVAHPADAVSHPRDSAIAVVSGTDSLAHGRHVLAQHYRLRHCVCSGFSSSLSRQCRGTLLSPCMSSFRAYTSIAISADFPFSQAVRVLVLDLLLACRICSWHAAVPVLTAALTSWPNVLCTEQAPADAVVAEISHTIQVSLLCK